MEKQWFLESIGPDGIREEFAITRLPCLIGRGKGNDLVVPSLGLSRIHAALVRDISGQLRLIDENSTNGTFVNRRRIEAYCLLKEDDIIHFGNAEFKLRMHQLDDSTVLAFDEMHTSIMPENMQLSENFLPNESEFEALIQGHGINGAAQPVVDARTRALFGYELLGRANHPKLPNTPIELFGLAETLGREIDLSLAFRHFGIGNIAPLIPGYPLFINTHPKEVFGDYFLATLERLLSASPDIDLVVEIHETAVTDSLQLRQLAARLDKMGIRFAYDDFGAGQARLLELADAPPHFVKFDMSLIRGLHQASERKRHVVEDLVRLVLSVGSVPLAEGVETEDEAKACLDMGFALLQGYLTGRPIPADAL